MVVHINVAAASRVRRASNLRLRCPPRLLIELLIGYFWLMQTSAKFSREPENPARRRRN